MRRGHSTSVDLRAGGDIQRCGRAVWVYGQRQGKAIVVGFPLMVSFRRDNER